LSTQALVAQVPEHQRLGVLPERHQRHDLALVEVDRQCALAGQLRRQRLAVLVQHEAGNGRLATGL
jgi:hypothetical protein